jgi:electron transfer flavoprotein alpha subunit
MNDRTKGEVWVFAEQEDGKLSEVPLELLGKGRALADELGVPLAAVLLGEGVENLATELFEGGADKVHIVESQELAVFRSKAYRHVMVNLVKEVSPQILIFGATHMGRDLAPAVASALKCGLTADCTELEIGEYTDPKCRCDDGSAMVYNNVLLQKRPAFGGNIIATIVNPLNWPQMATVREGVMKPLEKVPGRKGELVRHEAGLDGVDIPVEVIEIFRRESSVNLKGARIIVAGGAGMGSKDNFAKLFDLAEVLGGAVGASRAAVDLGYCEHERQIGQTGVTVRPALFISCGISGAVQHMAGMQDSAKIIAINPDKDAPIFKIAHYGIVGDANVVIPKMINAIKQKGG